MFVSGGVLSSLGKGVTTASIATLLKTHGYQVTIVKCENYLNQDAGMINPSEHGDPFLCADGTEADMDLGTYEKFLNQPLGASNFVTMGQIYKTVLDQERDYFYQGEDVEAIPHVTDEIIKRIQRAGTEAKADIVIVELGGTAGEYQNILYYEAARILHLKHKSRTLHIHVGYMPTPDHIGEPKTKPTQLSVKMLNSLGIQPDFIVVRGAKALDAKRRERFALFCNITPERVINNPDLAHIYQLPLLFREQDFDGQILDLLGMSRGSGDLTDWHQIVESMQSKRSTQVEVAIVGKYFETGEYQLKDAYAALFDALEHAAAAEQVEVKVRWISAESLDGGDVSKLKGVSGIIVPIGWGSRGVEGKINAIRYARTHKVPYLGLCYGLQLAVVEYARSVLGLENAHTIEVDPSTSDPVVHEIPFDPKYQRIKGNGTSMRLGSFESRVLPGSQVAKAYERYHGYHDPDNRIVIERHRHRYEVNNAYRDRLTQAGLVISGASLDDFFVEMIELPDSIHPFFVATQAHPEYVSTPAKPHPLFRMFIRSMIDQPVYKRDE